jgi:fluoroquinolone transport system ATP-binding protein
VADEVCDRVAFIVRGQIRAIDRPRELKLRYGQPRLRVEYSPDNGRAVETREFPIAGIGHNIEFLEILRAQTVETLHTMEASLEDVFIQVTGETLS